MKNKAPIKYKDVAHLIEEAAAQFWTVFTEHFPEITSGDSQMLDEDKAAFGLWLIGDSGEDNAVVRPGEFMAEVHQMFTDERIKECVRQGAAAGLNAWLEAGMPSPSEQELPSSIAFQLEVNVRHVLWANTPVEQNKDR